MSVFTSRIGKWLQASPHVEGEPYHFAFAEHHIGNVWIRSIHGGVSAAIIETCAEAETRKLCTDDEALHVSTSAIDYLRITKDADIFARATVVRKSRRLSIVDVVCWQDSEDAPVARGTVTIKVTIKVTL